MVLIVLGHLRVFDSINREGGWVGRAEGRGRIGSATILGNYSLRRSRLRPMWISKAMPIFFTTVVGSSKPSSRGGRQVRGVMRGRVGAAKFMGGCVGTTKR